MGSVTIAATFGSGGSVIGPAVAKKLALPFVDRAIPPALAAKIHEPLVAALADHAEERSAAGRLLNSPLAHTALCAGAPRPFHELAVSPPVPQTAEAPTQTRGLGH